MPLTFLVFGDERTDDLLKKIRNTRNVQKTRFPATPDPTCFFFQLDLPRNAGFENQELEQCEILFSQVLHDL